MRDLSRSHRRLVVAATTVSLLLLVGTFASVRPVAAADEWSTYSMTYRGTAAGREGLVGASGGLVAFSGGPGAVVGRLDAAPSGAAEASSIEPGTMARLVAGQVNGGAGEEVVGEPLTARAAFPGDTAEDSATQAGPQEAGPVTIAGGEASAAVGASGSRARASVATFRVAGQGSAATTEAFGAAATAWRTTFIDGDGGLAASQQPRATSATDDVRLEGAVGDGAATADATARSLRSTVTVGVERVVVRGALVLEGVVGRATAAAADTERSATATLDVAGVSVGGVPVTLDETGIAVAEEQVVAGQDVVAANEQLQSILTQAGIEVRLLEAVEQADDRTALANSGGVAIRLTTPSNPAVPRNELVLVLGRGEATLAAQPPSGAPLTLTPTVDDGGAAPAAAPTDGTAEPAPLGSAPAPGAGDPVDVPAAGTAPPADPAAPAVADEPATPSEEPRVVAAGIAMSRETAFAGFAAWMVFTSTIPMLGALLLGRRP